MIRFVALFRHGTAEGGETAGTVEASARRLLEAVTDGGAEVYSRATPGAALAAATDVDDGSGAPALAREGTLTVAADAALYYQADLRRALRAAGAHVAGPGAGHLIAAAYRAWGRACLARLEGDFAFVLHDGRTGTVLAARDHAGRRPIAWSELADGTLAVASGAPAILAHPGCRRDLDLVAVAEAAVGCVTDASATGHAAIRRLPAGHALEWTAASGGPPRIWAHWEPPTFESGSSLPFDEAAEELRDLLTAAVRERLDATAPTAVWLSGGRDSPSVFAAAHLARRQDPSIPPTMPVSLSYPPDDPGHEDGVIAEVAARWDASVRWVPAYDVPLIDTSRPAAERDGPFAHPFRCAHRMLADGSRAVGARVALDGAAGDALFRASALHLADLLRLGRWFALTREWRALGLGLPRPRVVMNRLVRPNLSEQVRRALARVRPPVAPYKTDMRRRVPPWIAPTFARTHGLERFGTPWPDRRAGETLTAHESRVELTWPFFQHVHEEMALAARSRGVDLRAPFLDSRLIAFAATRPLVERRRGRDVKYLLRRALADALPRSVVGDRTEHPGGTGGYLVHQVRTVVIPHLERMLEGSVLAELGIIDLGALRAAVRRVAVTGHVATGVWLVSTLDAERWLRSQLLSDTLPPVQAGGGLAPAARSSVAAG